MADLSSMTTHRPAPPSREDRFRGALLGLAVGDALGTTVEFRPRGTFPPVSDIVGGGPFDLPAGAWTDDTSMALCLADSLLARREHDTADALRRYVRWYREGERSSTGRCFDIGNATRQALELFEQTGDASAGTKFPDAGGNGVLMRLAPVAMAHAYSRGAAIHAAIRESNATHGHPGARDAAKLFAALLVDALQGGDRESVLGPDARFMTAKYLDDAVARVAAGSFRAGDGAEGASGPGGTAGADDEHDRSADGRGRPEPPPGIAGRGFAPPSLEAALWAVWSTRSFEDAVLAAVNLGDDADTTGAIAGQLAGALYGADAIPAHWRERVLLGDEITGLADGLRELSDELAAEHAKLPRPPGGPDADPQLPNDAFWFAENAILAGPYPGKPTRDAAAATLDALLDLGVTCFVDLTEEGEGPGPRGLHPYGALLRERAAARGVDAWHVRMAIRDVSVPEPWRMRAILEVIDAASAVGRRVYVHCWGGVGRTGTVLGCLTVQRGWSADEALSRLAHARRHTARARAGRVAPETAEQVAFVHGWRPPYEPRTPASEGGPGLIENDDLRITDVPATWDRWDEIARFAHTFDGYAVLGRAPEGQPDDPDDDRTVARAGEQANAVESEYHRTGLLPDDLDLLRGTLFFGFRADRFTWGDDTELSAPDDDGVTYVVGARDFESTPTARFRRALVARVAGAVQGRGEAETV
ncbi:ADP-ribosylglycohydrolase family protein [Patulibacter sp. NPDC049589]|uniref:ADP-ribosylglycohydrolase family protein n=1 Tax=Patulibacter sp. NPDC049589 TaxID=3154731 RepID=UPI003446677F